MSNFVSEFARKRVCSITLRVKKERYACLIIVKPEKLHM